MKPESRSERLRDIAGSCDTPQAPQLAPILSIIGARFGDKLAAVIYYGSCLRSGNPYDGLLDFYAIVDDYGPPGQSRIGGLANRLLAPNVYYAECQTEQGVLRGKCAVLSTAQLTAGTGRAFLSSIWGRFAQPVALVFIRSEADRDAVLVRLGEAVITLLEKALPALPARLPAADAFAAALALSYGGELRVEKTQRSAQFVIENAAEYRRRLEQAATLLPFTVHIDARGEVMIKASGRRRRVALLSWPLRRILGKIASVARLAKACFTFTGAVDYAAFKVERHTGVTIEVTDRLRRHPLIFGWSALWRVYRRKLLR